MSDFAAPTEQHQSFECARCGAPRMEFDPASGMLKCPQCGATHEIQVSAEAVAERDLTAALSDAGKARGMGREMKAVQCQACGALTQYEPNVTSATCPFCGSSQVLQQQPDPNLLRPESLVPFAVDQEAARGLYRRWLGKGFFRPKDLTRRAGAEQMTGVYLPFWTFDAHAESDWRAESGDYYYVTESYTETVDGRSVQKTRQVRKVRWYPTSGHHRGDYDDILIKGSETLDSGLFSKVANFDTGGLIPYQPDYLSGWAAESYSIPLADAWKRGKQVIEQREEAACDREVPGDTHRDLRVQTRISQTTFKHVLLPLWLASYRYNQKSYHFLVNGQTGQVGGQAPVDWLKVALVILLAAVIIGVILFFMSQSADASGSLLPFLNHLLAALPLPAGGAMTLL